MTFPLVILAGLSQDLFDAVSKQSAKAFAPNGALVLKPAPAGLSGAHADALIEAARGELRSLPEETAVNIVVLAVCPPDVDDTAFRQEFYPFSLYGRTPPPDYAEAQSTNARNRVRNGYVDDLRRAVTTLRATADVVKGEVSKANMSPLLLPVRNFNRAELGEMLQELHGGLAGTPDPKTLIRDAQARFNAAVPMVTPPSEGYAKQRRCFHDGRLFFKTPGKARHGFYRNALDEKHGETCLLNARARLGGGFGHDFHFDCSPTRRLDAEYPDCHGDGREPKEKHVNIGPSDAIIG